MSAWAIVRRIVVIPGPSALLWRDTEDNRSTGMISFCQFGAGRIGAIHAANIAAHPEARLNTIVETDQAAAERLAGRFGAVLREQAEALADPTINAVLIASSTDTHADLVEAAARAGKAIFCEKPLDLDRRRAAACAAVAEECGVPLMVAFNRRFDPNFARLEGEIRAASAAPRSCALRATIPHRRRSNSYAARAACSAT